MRRLLCCALLTIAAAPLNAQERIGFKIFDLGMPYSAMAGNLAFHCSERPTDLADQECRSRRNVKESIAGVEVQGIDLQFFNERLSRIAVHISERHFLGVAEALIEKYGAPRRSTEALQNRMGATFEGAVYTWKREGGVIRAEQYYGSLSDSVVVWMSDTHVAEFARRRASKAEARSRDL